ncbi:Radical SAM domain protein [Chloroherpeton thalassium ATCC 35110]|uniref:7-carboxy-7-deazaguanine synthase n=1 Tax=Chloroherpeton thalassium (strain ATCC 35110 / GB-78) TaxID=517418 RepID=B3QS64_CHLT3|nr:Radical SAM domain protein [Chloroherpeton thalassium ATCC 35110]
MLKVNEIFHSIQGESSKAGWPCVFIRLSGCDLRCSYCDTGYAFFDGKEFSQEEILEQVAFYKTRLVEITGGEPLLQPNVYPLMTALCEAGYEVLLETGGHHDVEKVDPRVYKIIDIKTPSSEMSEWNCYRNLELSIAEAKSGVLKTEFKIVLSSEGDYRWAKNLIERYDLARFVPVIFSAAFGALHPRQIAEWILADHLPVRLQLQLHKYIWPADMRGV